jgi:hypothetical protein
MNFTTKLTEQACSKEPLQFKYPFNLAQVSGRIMDLFLIKLN